MSRLLAALLVISSGALAEEALPQFPKSGQLIPMGNVGISYVTAGNNSATLVQFAPTLLVLARDHLVLGADFVYRSISNSGGGTTSGWGTSLIAGGAFSLDSRVSLLVLPAVGYFRQSSGPATRSAVSLGIFAPLLVHLAPHFFMGMGPQLDTEVTASMSNPGFITDKQTRFTFEVLLGGWI